MFSWPLRDTIAFPSLCDNCFKGENFHLQPQDPILHLSKCKSKDLNQRGSSLGQFELETIFRFQLSRGTRPYLNPTQSIDSSKEFLGRFLRGRHRGGLSIFEVVVSKGKNKSIANAKTLLQNWMCESFLA